MIGIGWQLKAGIALAVVGLIGYLAWREHTLTRKLAAAKVELSQANATLTAERAARAHERKISEDASHDFETRLKALDTARADTPVRSVRLCANRNVPTASAAPGGTDAPSAAGLPQTGGSDIEGGAGADIGPKIYALFDEADQGAAQCLALQNWVKSR